MQTQPERLAALELPELRALQRSGAIAIVGGAAKPHALGRVARCSGLELLWTETADGGTRLVEAVARRVRRGSVAAIVLVEGAMLHRHSRPVIAAARCAAVPVAYARKGSATQLAAALVELERWLASRRRAARSAA